MSSLEDEKLLQMVHDFIECESTTNNYNSSTKNNPSQFRQSTRLLTLQDFLKKTQEEKNIQEQIREHMENKTDMEQTKGLKQGLVNCLILDGLHASLRHISWVTTPCSYGSYEYIEIVEEDAKGNIMTLIVDINFKSQFEIARPTKSYKELLDKVPSIFVGNGEKLSNIINLLCSALGESLREQSLHIPPWRRANYMLSKWNLYTTTTLAPVPLKALATSRVKGGRDLSNYTNSNDNNKNNTNDNINCFNYRMGKNNGISKGVKVRSGSGSGLSNQFSKRSINCC